MIKTITKRQKKVAPKKGPKMNNLEEPKRKDLIPFVVRNYLTHDLSNVTCKQIVRSNNNGRS